MANKEVMIIADYRETSSLTLEELCNACHVSADRIYELIENDIILPQGRPDEWRFSMDDYRRIRRAIRIYHDLDVNWEGVAIVLDLLDEVEKLRVHMALFEKHFSKL